MFSFLEDSIKLDRGSFKVNRSNNCSVSVRSLNCFGSFCCCQLELILLLGIWNALFSWNFRLLFKLCVSVWLPWILWCSLHFFGGSGLVLYIWMVSIWAGSVMVIVLLRFLFPLLLLWRLWIGQLEENRWNGLGILVLSSFWIRLGVLDESDYRICFGADFWNCETWLRVEKSGIRFCRYAVPVYTATSITERLESVDKSRT